MEQKYIQAAIDYKKNVAGKFMLVEGSILKQRIDGTRFCVTRKIDGHLQIVFFNQGKAFMLNSNGRQNADGLKCLDSFAAALEKAGIGQAIIAAELYMPRPEGRPRCGDVSAALADADARNNLCLAPFDIVQLDDMPWQAEHYADTHGKLSSIFDDAMVRPVPMRLAESVDEVKLIYEEWVEGEGAEGLVVHSESPIVWKVKPRHSIDAAIIGYTSTERGIRDLMFAVRRDDGCFQMFALGSNGMSDDERLSLAERLSGSHVDSQYVLSDSRGIAYQMVKPEVVAEISALELVARGNDDKIRMNPLLNFDDDKGWIIVGSTPGVAVLGISFVKLRPDKQPSSSDVRVSQLSDLCPFERIEGDCGKSSPSTLLERHVFKKESGGKVMLHKFLLWKTNKESTGRFPAYVVFHTDFSSGRKELIKRDLAYSNDEGQIREILQAQIAENVKKGWEEVK